MRKSQCWTGSVWQSGGFDLGEAVVTAEVAERGLDHDRRLALVHEGSGMVASAKNPRLRRFLLTLRAEVVASAVRVTLPDGTHLWHPGAVAYRLERWSSLAGWDARTFAGLAKSAIACRVARSRPEEFDRR